MKHAIYLLFFILFISCNNDDLVVNTIDYTAVNEEEILAYLEDNDIDAQKSATGLYYVINEEGNGAQPTLNSNVTVNYKGYFTNGNSFDEVTDGVDFDLTSLIVGFSEGVTYLKEGGDGVFILPSRLAFGNTGSGPIPPGSVIIFDITLVSVN